MRCKTLLKRMIKSGFYIQVLVSENTNGSVGHCSFKKIFKNLSRSTNNYKWRHSHSYDCLYVINLGFKRYIDYLRFKVLMTSPRISRHIRDFLYDSAQNLKSGRQTKEPKYKETGGK